MAQIRFCSSLALEAICFLEKIHFTKREWMNKPQIEAIERFRERLPSDFGEDYIGMSTLSLALSAFTENELEDLSLDGLIRIFENPNQLDETVRARIKNEFQISFIYPLLDIFKNKYAAEYVKMLSTMQKCGFEEFYETDIMPLVKAEIQKNYDELKGRNTEQLLSDISALKCGISIPSPKIFVSFFSAPTAFSLYNGSFLTCFMRKGYNFLTLIAHELMHGFASDEVTDMYQKYVASDEYLSEMHRRLIEDFHSGDEEEFVMAAEYYLCLRAGIASFEQCMDMAKKRHDGACPVSVLLFKLLSEEAEIPTDYNAWLIDQFKDGKLPQSDIRQFIKSL